MKKMMFFAVLVIVSMTAFAQVSKEEQELIDLWRRRMLTASVSYSLRMRSLFTWVDTGVRLRNYR